MQEFFGKKNYLGIALAIVLLGVGFFLLGLKPADNKIALNVAPFVLIIAYAIILPVSILMDKDKGEKK
jgi:hypothetical protein